MHMDNCKWKLFPTVLVILFCYPFTANCEFKNVKLTKCLYNELGFSRELKLPNTIMLNNQTTHFKLQLKCATRLPHCMQPCSTEILRRPIPFSLEERSPDVYFTPGGFLKFGVDFFHPDEYCVLGSSRESVTIEICRPKCGHNGMVCVPKCCSGDKVLDNQNGFKSCQYSYKKFWEPLVYQTEDLQICGDKRVHTKFHYYQFKPPANCSPDLFYLKSDPRDLKNFRVKFRLLLNGSVVLRELLQRKWIIPKEGEFCLDGIQNFGASVGPYNGDPLDSVLLVCSSGHYNEQLIPKNGTLGSSMNKLTVTGILYCILLLSGTPFLLMTIVVYVLLWTKQNVHGWTLFSHTLAMLLNYLGQGVTNTVTRLYDSDDNASTSCRLIGIANHYFALASFCWLTMINYDLWSMFRHLESTVGRSKGLKRFMVYMIFGWGVPFIFVLISFMLDWKYGLHGVDGGSCANDIIVPLYGHKSCLIAEEARPYYLFYPIGALMTINIIFAGLTAFNMHHHNASAKLVDKKSTKHKRKFSVYLKLFIVMGVALTSEVVVWNLKEKDVTLPWYLVFPDFLSLLQAIAIFILFACQSKIINQLYDTYPTMRGFLEKVRRLPCY